MTEALRTDQARAAGRALRQKLKRTDHAGLLLPAERDPVGVLEAQHRSRLAELIGVRIGRMLQSPFTYYRGTAAQMACDLAAGQTTDLRVVSCGDAHLSNFGLYASPERQLLFDLNDFDEGAIAPWEWDVKRLAASIHIGGRDIGLSERACRDASEQAVTSYQTSLADLMELTALERYYTQVNTDQVMAFVTSSSGRRVTRDVVRKARRRTADQVLARITTRRDDGRLCIVDEPPITRHADHATLEQMNTLFDQYRSTLREDTAVLLSQFEIVDTVLRVVGVGSVGTRCYVILLLGPSGEALFLQAKEAQDSVLVSHGGMPPVVPGHPGDRDWSQGHRVVAAQRVLQAQSDPFLGWITGWAGDRKDRPRVDYYWRQFRDMKGSVEVSRLDRGQFTLYGQLCAKLLARAHSQSPAAAAIAGYLGGSAGFAEAVSAWACAYADICEADFDALAAAVAAGRLPVERNV